MTLDEAIKWLKEDILTQHPYTPGRTSEAKQLGVEAQKVLKHGRLIGAHHDPDLLPGETKE